MAAQAGVRYSIQHPAEYERTNVMGTLNILELMKEFKIKNIVYASSSSVYGGVKKTLFKESMPLEKPISFYAATKKMNELMAHTYHSLYGFNCTGLRYFTVYGPWGRPDMALFKFTKNILQNQPIELYNHGNMKRDFTFITDIAAGTVSALDKCYPYEIFNLGDSRSVQLTYFVECIEKALGMTAQKKLLPMQQGDVVATYADISKAKKKLGYKPKVPIEEGILKFINWYRSYYLK